MTFPIDLSGYKSLAFTPSQKGLSDAQRETLKTNIGLVRDSLIFFTALANVKGLGGHTGGAYDIVPEVLIMDGFHERGRAFFPGLLRRGRSPGGHPVYDGGTQWP